MAGTQRSTRQTSRQPIEFNLKSALVQFASQYMQEKLEQSAHDCDQRIERELLPKLLVILREIDQARSAFEELQKDAALELRDQMSHLGCTTAAIDDAVEQVRAVVPRYLGLLPTAASLAVPSADTSSLPARPSSGSPTPVDSDGSPPGVWTPTTGTCSLHQQDSNVQNGAGLSFSQPRGYNGSVRVMTASSTTARSSKRPNESQIDESDTPTKRQKASHENCSETTGSTTTRQIKFSDLEPAECMFRHGDQEGYFVIRCDKCEATFVEPPLAGGRASFHFDDLHQRAPFRPKLTSAQIFDKYSYRVDVDGVSPKDLAKHTQRPVVHTFHPQATPRSQSTRKYSSLIDESAAPRRNLRNVRRPDYAELVANRDPWSVPDTESEKARKSSKGTPASSSSRRKSKTPSLKASQGKSNGLADNKPFGYLSEPWPRRSAPR